MPQVLFSDGEVVSGLVLELPADNHLDVLFRAAVAAGGHFDWRGRPSTRDALMELMWSDAFEHCVAVDAETAEALAYVSVRRTNLIYGVAYIEGVDIAHVDIGDISPVIDMLIRRLFERTAIRKLYFEDFGEGFLSQWRPSLRTPRGRLAEHRLIDGTYRDLNISSVSRSTAEEHLRVIA